MAPLAKHAASLLIMTMKPNKNPILKSLRTVHEKYPTEPIQLWIRQQGDIIEYSLNVGDHPDRVYGPWLTNVEEATEMLIDKAGERSPEVIRTNRIQELREELLRLEEEAADDHT